MQLGVEEAATFRLRPGDSAVGGLGLPSEGFFFIQQNKEKNM